GIARLSNNWIIARLATVYIEIVRNIPLLLQIFFWYIGVLRALPNPRQSFEPLPNIFLNSRGLIVPTPVLQPGIGFVFAAFVLACAGSFFLWRWARFRQQQTGQQFPVFWSSVGMIVLLPLLAFFLSGSPISLVLPELTGFNFATGSTLVPELVALVLALSIYTASFIAEIVRSGIQAVSWGQTEAASSLGLHRGQTLRLVIIPQAMRVIIPPLTNQYLNLTKNSSLAAAIAYPELVSVFAGIVLNQTGQAVEVLSIVIAIYLSLSVVTSIFMNWYNARFALVER
ncbi:MAG: ABC transporter permease subunit, partial [Hyphomicrobiales bacterium]|nr:ABC transporter permease subunit [Hyphomicrobiales bacterium]